MNSLFSDNPSGAGYTQVILTESWLLATFGEVESMGTSPKGLEALSLSHGAVFPAFLWIGKHCETSKRPCFTKSGQEPTLTENITDFSAL